MTQPRSWRCRFPAKGIIPTQACRSPWISTAIFLVDIDGQVSQLRASVHFDDDKIESSFREHSRHLIFSNPYRQAIAGMVSQFAARLDAESADVQFLLESRRDLRSRADDSIPLQHICRSQADRCAV